MEPALPLKSVVLFIACGTMVFIIVFIFAKRQITRFALKSRGPHIPIGSDIPKKLKQEIERRLARVNDIRFEPLLMPDPADATQINIHKDKTYYYRMKVLDSLVLLDTELKLYSPLIRRCVGQHTLRSFLLEQRQSGPLEGVKVDVIERFTELYDHARHETLEFSAPQYKEFLKVLNRLINHIRKRRVLQPSHIDDISETTSTGSTSHKSRKDHENSVAKMNLKNMQTNIMDGLPVAGEVVDVGEDLPAVYIPGQQSDLTHRRLKETAGSLSSSPPMSDSSTCVPEDGSQKGSKRGSGNFETCL